MELQGNIQQPQIKPAHAIPLLLATPTAIGDENVPVFGKTRLMKMMFLFEKEVAPRLGYYADPADFGFEAYKYGPFSRKVYEAVDFLDNKQIITIFPVPSYKSNRHDRRIDRILTTTEENLIDFSKKETYESEGYQLTPQGKRMMKSKEVWFAWSNLLEHQKERLIQFKTSITNTPLPDILLYVYSKYPGYAAKSVIYDQVFSSGG
jgi:hypothetical protein